MFPKIRSHYKISLPILGIFLTIFLAYHMSCRNDNSSLFSASNKSPLVGTGEVADAVKVQDTFRKIYNLYQNSVVFISTEQTVKLQSSPFFNDPFFRDFFGQNALPQGKTEKRQGLGTGFILSEDGYICTNYHVIADVDKINVKVDNKNYVAAVVGYDERTDIALLKIQGKGKFQPVFLGDSDKVNVGDWAIAIGNPFGLDKTFTTGVISAIARKDLDLMGDSQTHIQTDASINPGNSGGPLINIYGEVIGINRMIYSQSGGNMGIGFAIPINKAKDVLEQLKTHKKVKRGYIGVQIVPLTDDYAGQLGLAKIKGALIGGVMNNSPAEKGGIQVGDVILKINNKEIASYTDVVQEVEKTEIGKTLKVTVWRNKQEVNLFITVKERP